MPTKKKESEKAVKQSKKIDYKISKEDMDKLYDVINEMQENLNYVNDKLARIIDRMGLNI